MSEILLGLDIGSSSIKASLVRAETGETIASAQSPSEEMAMVALRPGWAEQDPEEWWRHIIISTKAALQKAGVNGTQVKAIGIAYQMHGLVVVDKNLKPLRSSIIWCDSRAVETGEVAFSALGQTYCLENLLNSPSNFTASKLKWVQDHEPELYEKIYKIMLPGDFIAMKLSGEVSTTDTGLSEGIFWEFTSQHVSEKLLSHYKIDKSLLPDIKPVFSIQSTVSKEAAQALGIAAGTPIAYRSGDQPNNAFSLRVLNPGETAATAGTSGVIYSVTDQNAFDVKSRVNTFVHVSNEEAKRRNGVLLCINGTGILNSWLRKSLKGEGNAHSYEAMNSLAAQAPIGSEGLSILPFGNGAERVLENRDLRSSFHGLDFNQHSQAHLLRAAQEGIVFALYYGFEVLNGMGLRPNVIRAGHANLFLSPLFREAFVNTTGVKLELFNTDGAKGAALGAGMGAGVYHSFEEAFRGLKHISVTEPVRALTDRYREAYGKWVTILKKEL